MPLGERVAYALRMLIVGLGAVFAILALLWGILVLARILLHDMPARRREENGAKESTKPSAPAPQPVVKPAPAPVAEEKPPMPQEYDAPPAYDDADAPPPYGEPVAPAAAPIAAVPADMAGIVPAQGAGGKSELWWTLIEKYKDHLAPMYRFMLDDACGEVEGDVLIVRCGDDLTRDSLDCPPVAQVLCGVTGEYLGRSIQVRFIIGKADKAISGEDRLEALIRAGSKFDSFTVK
jgi:DNA polymerase-3 subunit gamma/tau